MPASAGQSSLGIKNHAGIPSLKETDSDSMLVFRGNVSARHFVTVDSFLLIKLHSLLSHSANLCRQTALGGARWTSLEHDPT